MVRSRNLGDPRAQPIVAAPEPELLRLPAQENVRAHVLDLFPGHADAPTATDPGSEPAEQASTCAPDTRAAENCDELELLARISLECQVVGLAAAALLRIEQLVVEHVQTEIDLLAQFWPRFVRIISGIADSAITMMTTR